MASPRTRHMLNLHCALPNPPREGSDGLFIARWTAATWTACLLIRACQLGGGGGVVMVVVVGAGG